MLTARDIEAKAERQQREDDERQRRIDETARALFVKSIEALQGPEGLDAEQIEHQSRCAHEAAEAHERVRAERMVPRSQPHATENPSDEE